MKAKSLSKSTSFRHRYKQLPSIFPKFITHSAPFSKAFLNFPSQRIAALPIFCKMICRILSQKTMHVVNGGRISPFAGQPSWSERPEPCKAWLCRPRGHAWMLPQSAGKYQHRNHITTTAGATEHVQAMIPSFSEESAAVNFVSIRRPLSLGSEN